MTLILAAELLLFVALPASIAYAIALVVAALVHLPLVLALVPSLLAGAAGEVWIRRRCCRDSQGEWVEAVEKQAEVIW